MKTCRIAVAASLLTIAACEQPAFCDNTLDIRQPSTLNSSVFNSSRGLAPYYIYSQDDADFLVRNNCTNVLTRVIISPNSTSTISLNRVQWVTQSLELGSSTSLSNFSAPDLYKISGNLSLSDLSSLSTIDFPQLNSVESYLSLHSLPLLKSIEFPKAQGYVGSTGYNISETGLASLNFSLHPTPFLVRLVNNSFLENMNLSAITGEETAPDIFISGNGNTAVDLSNLTGAGNLQLEDCKGVNISSLVHAWNVTIMNNNFAVFNPPSLISVDGYFIAANNPNLSLINLSNLTRPPIVVVQNNSLLQEIDLPASTGVSTLTVQDNPQLTNLTVPWLTAAELTLIGNISNISFPSLKYSFENLTVYGPVSNLSMPQVVNLWGNVNVTSTYQPFDCSALDMIYLQNPKRGKSYSCQSIPPGSNKDVAIHARCYNQFCLSHSAKLGIGLGVGLGVPFLALLGWFCYRYIKKRREKRRTTIPKSQPLTETEMQTRSLDTGETAKPSAVETTPRNEQEGQNHVAVPSSQ